MPGSDDNKRLQPVTDIENWNLDRSVDPPTKVTGLLGKNSSQAYEYISSNANHILVSGTVVTTASPVSADSSSISAIQGDAAKLRISGIIDSGSISAKSSDAGTMRISAINSISSLSPDAALFRVSGIGTFTVSASTTFLVSAHEVKQSDAASLRMSGIVDSGSISAKSSGADTFLVSAKQGDAAIFRVSAILAAGVSSVGAASFGVSASQLDAGVLRTSSLSNDGANQRVSSVQIDAGLQHTSAFVDSGSVSAKSGDANQLHVSSVQGDAGLLRVSGFTSTATNFPVSAVQADANLQHTSGFSGDANQLHTSSVQGDANLQHVSASLMPDTTGGLTIFRNLNLSSSIAVKSTAGSVYGWHAWNSDTKPNYIRFQNTSGAINVGTDTPIMTLYLKASGISDQFIPMGLKGFTAGIGLVSVSAEVDTATTGGTASAVGINLFYK